jgi:hypothetical protein
VVEPLPFGRGERERFALADPCGEAVNRLAGLRDLLDDRACPAHGGDGRGRQRRGLTMPGGRDDLVTVRSLPFSTIVIDCSPIYN